LKITATVVEFNGQTQLNEPEIEIIGKVSPPTPLEIVLPADNARLESAEGMLVNFSQSLVVSDYHNYDRYGEIILALTLDGYDRPMQPTAYISPEKAPAEFEKLSSRLIILDDGRMEQNPDPTRHPNANDFNTQNRFRGGDKLQNTLGILSYAYGSYRIQPTAAATYISTNPD